MDKMNEYKLSEAEQIIDLFTELLSSQAPKIKKSRLNGYSILDIHYSLALCLANDVHRYYHLSNDEILEYIQDFINVEANLLFAFPSRLISDQDFEKLENLNKESKDYQYQKFQITYKYDKIIPSYHLENIESMETFGNYAISIRFEEDYWEKISNRLGIKIINENLEKEFSDEKDTSTKRIPSYVPMIILIFFLALGFFVFNYYFLATTFLIFEIVYCLKLFLSSVKMKERVLQLVVISISIYGVLEYQMTQIIAALLIVFGGIQLAYLKYKEIRRLEG